MSKPVAPRGAKVALPAPASTGPSERWDEDLHDGGEAERGSTDDLLDALTEAMRGLHDGGGEIDRKRALRDSFTRARRGLGASKALLLYVAGSDPLQLQVLYSAGLTQEQNEACRELRSSEGEGVSPRVIRQAIDDRESVFIPNAQALAPGQATASLAGGSHSVLCAPILEPHTGAVMAVLYFQNQGMLRAFQPRHLNWLNSYATALGHGFGMHLATQRRIEELEREREGLRQGVNAPELIGESEATRRLREALNETFIPEVVNKGGRTILILGPSGTGKDLIARYLHYYSTRGKGPFVAYNCAGLRSGDMMKSILFGHVRGSFTGAHRDSPGLFRDANKGVLFLDEIGDLPLDGQAELLRVLQDSRVTPLGSSQSIHVDVQLVVATNRDIEAEAAAGRFREDLYYRLAVHTIRLAPLAHRSRRGDVRPLLAYCLAAQERLSKKKTGGLTPEALMALLAYAWPGNVRELINVCTRLVTYARPGAVIDINDIETHCPRVVDPAARRVDAEVVVVGDTDLTFKEAALVWERDFLRARIEHCGGNITRAAESLDLGYSTLMRKLQLQRERQKKSAG